MDAFVPNAIFMHVECRPIGEEIEVVAYFRYYVTSYVLNKFLVASCLSNTDSVAKEMSLCRCVMLLAC